MFESDRVGPRVMLIGQGSTPPDTTVPGTIIFQRSTPDGPPEYVGVLLLAAGAAPPADTPDGTIILERTQ